jgi:starch synthase
MNPMRILMVSAELAPLAKAGGLGDMVAGLSRALRDRGHDVRILLPRYRLPGMPQALLDTGVHAVSPVRTGVGEAATHPEIRLWTATAADGLPLLLADVPQALPAGEIYGSGAAERQRFALLAHAATLVLASGLFEPQIVHCHDWHAGLVPLLLRALPRRPRTVLTLHNVGYPGSLPAAEVDDLGLGGLRSELFASGAPDTDWSFLRAGIATADGLTTVSPTHAAEILTPSGGFGLDALLRDRQRDLRGILNGIDTTEWNPATDRHLPATYSVGDLGGKQDCRRTLLERAGLAPGPGPVIGCVSRLAHQKGLDLWLAALPPLLSGDRLRAVVLGSGDPILAAQFATLARDFPGRFWFADAHDEGLARLIYAGSDAMVVPSRYEPCGLTQLYAMRYGTVPVVRRTGGLADTVTHFDPVSGRGTGSVFADADVGGISWGVGQLLDWFAAPGLWSCLVANGMARNSGWETRVGEYESVYRA